MNPFAQAPLVEDYQKKIIEIEKKAEKEPQKIRFTWDLARTKMEAYFDRNLSQISLIFWISVIVMIIGFGFLLFAIFRSMNEPKVLPSSFIAAVTGMITEFIGATFMLLYRSTMKQAASYMATLERINSVGMAVHILDSISEEQITLKDNTRSKLVTLLLKEDKD
jgi:hypothetical protein